MRESGQGEGPERGVGGKELVVGAVGSASWGWGCREGGLSSWFGRWAQPSLTRTLARKQGQRTEEGNCVPAGPGQRCV